MSKISDKQERKAVWGLIDKEEKKFDKLTRDTPDQVFLNSFPNITKIIKQHPCARCGKKQVKFNGAVGKCTNCKTIQTLNWLWARAIYFKSHPTKPTRDIPEDIAELKAYYQRIDSQLKIRKRTNPFYVVLGELINLLESLE